MAVATSQIEPPASTHPEPRIHRFTREDYYRMADMGLFNGGRVELIEGRVIEMTAQKNPHALSVVLTDYALRPVFSSGFFIRVQLPFRLNDRSEPEPDIAVIPGSPRDYTDHPDVASLIVEIADSTLDFDRKTKGRLYAVNGIRDYWIVNLIDRCVEVYRDPTLDPVTNHTIYANRQTLFASSTISPLAAPQASIKVADFLP